MERLLTRQLVANLGGMTGNAVPVTSVYLGLEEHAGGKQQLLAQFKDLAGKNGGALLEGRLHDEKASIRGDMERCGDFLENIRKLDVLGLAMFSCAQKGMFETVGVPVPFRPHVIVSHKAAVAPLMSALDEFKRIAVCLVDRREARLFEYFMGRMEEVASVVDEVPGRVRVGGWRGYEESRITRHIAGREYEHLKNVAEALFEQFKLRGFDWLFLGVRPELREEAANTLHNYVRTRLVGYIDATYKTPAKTVRTMTIELAESLKAKEGVRLVETLVAAAKSGDHAVLGLRKTLKALNLAAVGRLLVRRDLYAKGVACVGCGHLGLRRRQCPLCGKSMKQRDNVIDLAEEVAGEIGAEIRHIKGESHLDDFEGIGAFLRFPIRK